MMNGVLFSLEESTVSCSYREQIHSRIVVFSTKVRPSEPWLYWPPPSPSDGPKSFSTDSLYGLNPNLVSLSLCKHARYSDSFIVEYKRAEAPSPFLPLAL